ncbi:hypothetical protein ACM66B_003930 [Microbotryomycetes sp. NB124-2]
MNLFPIVAEGDLVPSRGITAGGNLSDHWLSKQIQEACTTYAALSVCFDMCWKQTGNHSTLRFPHVLHAKPLSGEWRKTREDFAELRGAAQIVIRVGREWLEEEVKSAGIIHRDAPELPRPVVLRQSTVVAALHMGDLLDSIYETEKFKALFKRVETCRDQESFEGDLQRRGGGRLISPGLRVLSEKARKMTCGVLLYQMVRAGHEIENKPELKKLILDMICALPIETKTVRNRFIAFEGGLLNTARELAKDILLCSKLQYEMMAEARKQHEDRKRARMAPVLSKRGQARYDMTNGQLQRKWDM